MYAAAGLWSGTNDEMIAKLAKLPLEAQPGTLFRYGLQQEVQGAIIRRLTGEGLDAFLERAHLRSARHEGHRLRRPRTSATASPRATAGRQPQLLLPRINRRSQRWPDVPAGSRRRCSCPSPGSTRRRRTTPRSRRCWPRPRIARRRADPRASSVKLMTSNLLAEGVPVRFLQPFVGVGYGMNRRHRSRPGARRFQRRRARRGHVLLGRCARHLVLGGSGQRHRRRRHGPAGDAGNPMTGRPYPVTDIRGISRSITYGALVDPAL